MANEILASLLRMTMDDDERKSFDERNEEFETKTKEQMINRDKQRALDEEQFAVFYQPKHDTKTGKIVGAEALVRWKHPELGTLYPIEFIPAFEDNGFIVKLDKFVREQVFTDMERWDSYSFNTVPISINLSKVDFTDTSLVESIDESAKKHRIDPSKICFEITETACIDNQNVITYTISRLRDCGFMVALDDFGSGYSSLSMLNKLPLDTLKIDKTLLENIKDDKEKFLLDTCIKLARNYDLTTEVEGVETKEQYDLLKLLNCDSIQGYYFSKPMPVELFEERIRNK